MAALLLGDAHQVGGPAGVGGVVGGECEGEVEVMLANSGEQALRATDAGHREGGVSVSQYAECALCVHGAWWLCHA